jgi:hypothetical protein
VSCLAVGVGYKDTKMHVSDTGATGAAHLLSPRIADRGGMLTLSLSAPFREQRMPRRRYADVRMGHAAHQPGSLADLHAGDALWRSGLAVQRLMLHEVKNGHTELAPRS